MLAAVAHKALLIPNKSHLDLDFRNHAITAILSHTTTNNPAAKIRKFGQRFNMDENKTDASPPLTELILSLEQARVMAKQLPATTDPTHFLQIHYLLHQANRYLSSLLSNTQLPASRRSTPAENSLYSATGPAADENRGELMEVGDDDEENNSKTTIDKVEESMRHCFIKNKRAKRPLSPSSLAVAEEKRLSEDRLVGGANGFDPQGTKLRALDLVYQFHG